MLEVGAKAPDFVLYNQQGEEFSSESLKGKRYLVYFYPRDNTPGCTKQACAFAEHYAQFKELQIPVMGVSKDSVVSHGKFVQKYQLPFTLLSDPELKLIQAYGVWQEKKLYGKLSFGVVRSAFLVGKDGCIEQVWPKVKPEQNPLLVLEWIKENA